MGLSRVSAMRKAAMLAVLLSATVKGSGVQIEHFLD